MTLQVMEHRKHALILLVGMLIILLTLFLSSKEGATGFFVASKVAYGGNVTRLSMNISPLWTGYFGNLTNSSDDPTNLTVALGGDAMSNEQDLGLERCFGLEIYATNGTEHRNFGDPLKPNETYLDGLEAGTAADVDDFLNVPGSDERSGTRMFNATNTTDFAIGTTTLTVRSTRLNPRNGSYNLGLLKDNNGNLVFVINVLDDEAVFTGNASDYQIILPSPPNRATTYSFFQDITDACGAVNITITPLLFPRYVLVNRNETINLTINQENVTVNTSIFFPDGTQVILNQDNESSRTAGSNQTRISYSLNATVQGNYSVQTNVTYSNTTATLNSTFAAITKSLNSLSSIGGSTIMFIDNASKKVLTSGVEIDGSNFPANAFYEVNISLNLSTVNNGSHIYFRNFFISDTDTVIFNLSEITDSITPPENTTKITTFSMETNNNSFSDYDYIYNYSAVVSSIQDEDDLRLYRCSSVSNCTLVSLNITLNTTTNILNVTRSTLSVFMLGEGPGGGQGAPGDAGRVGGGGGGVQKPRCGNRVCERQLGESCSTCDIDCGTCPSIADLLDKKTGIESTRTLRVSKEENRALLIKVEQFVEKQEKCAELRAMLKKARDQYTKGQYSESYLLIESIQAECNRLLEEKELLFEFSPPVDNYDTFLLLLIVGCVVLIVILAHASLKEQNMLRKIKKELIKTGTHRERSR